MHIVALAWMFVVLLWALAEATAPQGSLLGAFFTLVGYGLLPLALVLYLMGTPMRRRARLAAETQPEPEHPTALDSHAAGDSGRHPAGEPIAPERKEP